MWNFVARAWHNLTPKLHPDVDLVYSCCASLGLLRLLDMAHIRQSRSDFCLYKTVKDKFWPIEDSHGIYKTVQARFKTVKTRIWWNFVARAWHNLTPKLNPDVDLVRM